jgi:hypothetical protein
MHLPRRTSTLTAVVAATAAVAGCGGGGDSAPAQSDAAAAATASAPMATIPDLIGRHQDAAHRAAARAGFTLRWTGFAGKLAHGRYNVSCAKILRQSPAGGERRPRGAQISVIETACKTPKTGPQGIDW